MNKKIYNYEKEIEINPNALDIEWLEQPKLFLKYAEAGARARKAMDEAKEKLDIVRAKLDKEIREDPEKFSLKKVTESAVSNAIVLQDKYKEASQALIQAKYEMDLLMKAVAAFEQRKTALENLVRLYGQSYFAGPQEPRDLGMEWERRVKSNLARDKIKRRMKRNG